MSVTRWHRLEVVVAGALALLFALAPVVNDVCGLGCEKLRAPVCPQHAKTQTPDHCGHDHGGMRASLPRLDDAAAQPDIIALAVAEYSLAAAVAGTRAETHTLDHDPPPITSPSTELRI